MTPHPYRNRPDYSFWSRAVAAPAPGDLDPVVAMPFRITAADKVATAGSCFAQHVARHLARSGFTYFVTEPGHPVLTDDARERFNYGIFPARFGNIYTSRQLLQLIERAYGRFEPAEAPWRGEDGGWIDPFRPTIQRQGFASRDELERDRRQHLAAVRRMFEEMDVFVFTMGLTEGWIALEDGAAFSVCPGVSGGEYDPARHAFHNEDVDEVVANMTAFIAALHEVNPHVRIILTVSPVPLAATAENRHVLVSTTYSKSVLRVAADILARQPGIAYFPSYEIITGNFSRGRYYAENLRDVVEEGVAHVMRIFFRHATDGKLKVSRSIAPATDTAAEFDQRTEEIVETLCDEALLDQPAEQSRA